jgi:hypothetical protein
VDEVGAGIGADAAGTRANRGRDVFLSFRILVNVLDMDDREFRLSDGLENAANRSIIWRNKTRIGQWTWKNVRGWNLKRRWNNAAFPKIRFRRIGESGASQKNQRGRCGGKSTD